MYCDIVDSHNRACGASSSSFVDLPAGALRFGSAGRNTVIGPGFNNWDAGVAKNTRFKERYNLQFRAEFFDLFNHANFFQPARIVNVTAPALGVITAAQPSARDAVRNEAGVLSLEVGQALSPVKAAQPPSVAARTEG
jgi:hypothetical protein